MYEEYLGKEYHSKIRKMLTLGEDILPDSVIDADINIGAMKMLVAPVVEKLNVAGKRVNSEEQFEQLSQASVYYLSGVLCSAMKSRTSAPPYNKTKYQKAWDKKQRKYMAKGNFLMKGLML